ncbi:YwmB family TATA-box binding protein [Peribacillus frigoritolerans]|uniref:YwmB family TATA-box binding protein n=1 Tax=Peribacillus frigoritolerans TaxID=450367 RepID=UPI0020796690|nr:YwmB family TATA-box binding protein [Peribacillus frigoritolerans]USK67267.1 YwmB family TATA-box binding protein [Peribacillus frigoritolerans]
MKLNLVTLLFIFSFLILSRSAHGQNFNLYNNVNDFLKVASENQIEIREWRVVYGSKMENVEQADLNKMVTTLIRDESFSWSEEGNEIHHKTITGVKGNDQQGFQITISLIKNGELFDVNQSYQIKGKKWVSLNKGKAFNIPAQFKKGNPYITVAGKKVGQDIKQLESNILDSLSASYVEGLKEKNFISISGLSNKFDDNIQTNTGEVFNVQIGLRKSENKEIQITMGTPIITTEY